MMEDLLGNRRMMVKGFRRRVMVVVRGRRRRVVVVRRRGRGLMVGSVGRGVMVGGRREGGVVGSVGVGRHRGLVLAPVGDDPRGERRDVIGVRRGLADVRQRGLRDGSETVGQRRKRLLWQGIVRSIR